MFWPLTGLLAIVPVCGLFLWLDTARVAKWRAAILALWLQRDIELLAFGHAMRAVPNLPEATLSSMLILLGATQTGGAEVGASAQTRRVVAAVAGFADALALRQLALKVCATAIVSISVCWAAAANAWPPLALLALLLPLPLIQRYFQSAFQRQSTAAILAAHQHPDFDADTFRRLIDKLPLGSGQACLREWADRVAQGATSSIENSAAP
jgi:hypothetical protein